MEAGNKNEAKKATSSIVRIAGRDINGSYKIQKALNQVKGIGINLASSIALVAEKKFNIKKESSIGSLSEDQISKLEAMIKNPSEYGIPSYMLNRRKDSETGKDMHLVGSDLIIKVKQVIDEDVKMQTWRGFRHQYGQKVRGQKTRSTGRTGATVGVMKKTVQAAQAAAKAEGAQAAKTEKK
ncbi:MAG: 30S ribosomal protein S13 [Candidatus Micrarchaeia archaeon]